MYSLYFYKSFAYCCLLLFSLTRTVGPLYAQSIVFSDDLLTKYLHYKERFTGHFFVPGTEPGCGIPFSSRRIEGKEHILRSGESTLKLGNYLAVLGTEYRMFKQLDFPIEQTLEHMYSALYALNRLDLAAEPNDPTGDYRPRLNGLFIREDFPPGFFDKYEKQLNKNALSWPGKAPQYIRGSGQIIMATGNREEEINDHRGLAHRYMSHDHAVRVLWGLKLAYHMLDEDLSYQDRAFQDGIIDLKTEIEAIYSRIIAFFERNNWRIRRPNGEKVDRGALVYIFKRELRRSMMDFVADNSAVASHRRFTLFYGLFHQPFLGLRNTNAWMNGRMQMETQNLSGNRFRAWERCRAFGYENYFMTYGMLVHGWQLAPDQRKILRENMLFYLEMAPEDGNFYHQTDDFSTYGWATPDRTARPLEDVWLGIFTRGNFSGLDFMLMHNLFYLVFDSPWHKVFLYDKDAVFEGEWHRLNKRLSLSRKRENSKTLEQILALW